MSKPIDFKIYLLVAVGFLVECLALANVITAHPFYETGSKILVLFLHILSAVLAAAGFYFLDDEKKRQVYPFIFILVLSIPILGYIGVVQFLIKRKYVKSPELVLEYREHVKADVRGGLASEGLKKTFGYLRKGLEMESMHDVLDEEEGEGAGFLKKLEVIRNLGRINDSGTINALVSLMDDAHMDVRYYAGEEIARISDQFNIFINELKREIKEDPDNPELYTDMGRLLLHQAFSGLYDEDTMQTYLHRAEEALEKSLRIKPDQYDPLYLLGRIHISREELEKAEEYFQKAREADINEVSALIGLVRCAWKKKEIDKIDALVTDVNDRMDEYEGENKEALLEFIKSWRTDAANPVGK